jgi:hypothetical protein
MSTLGGRAGGHNFHGAPERFEVVARFIYERFGRKTKYVADVAGGQGMLTRILRKKYNYEAEVVDPRGWTLVGVPNRKEEYSSVMADFYDLIVGLHPDQATRAVAESAKVRPTILIPCCNFWDNTKKLGREGLLSEIEKYYTENGITYERVVFDFASSKNVGLVTIK